ncbi:MAG TPA: leucine-rich repeat domain-containing protein [Pirellula sp.]|nr:leucine-rich repeat domain-containing protein [Pirellula sp.]
MAHQPQLVVRQRMVWLQLSACALWILTCGPMRAEAQLQRNPAADSDSEGWIRSLGGRLAFNSAGLITSIELPHAWLIDSDLKKLANFPELVTIDLAYTKVTDEGLSQLKSLENVRFLSLFYAENVTDTGIAHLKHWKRLEQLNVRGTKVTSTLFEHLANMLSLRSLDVGFSRVNDDNFERLGELPNLERFSIGGNKMSGTALPLLKLLPNLRELAIGGQQRTDSGLWSISVTDFNVSHIADLSGLKMLDLSGTAISDSGVAQLSRLKKLETLDLSRTKLTAKGVSALAKIQSLRHLKLAQSASIDDSVLIAFQTFENLEVLELQETKITYEGLMRFSPKSNLKKLFIGGAALTPEQVEAVRLRFPSCYVSWWPKTEILDG